MLEVLEIIIDIILVIVFFPIILLIYVVCGILDLTYHERHKTDIKNAENCPYFIDSESDYIDH